MFQVNVCVTSRGTEEMVTWGVRRCEGYEQKTKNRQ